MMKKKLLIAFLIFVIVAVPFSVFAATSDTAPAKTIRGFFGIDMSKLNDQQKSDVKTYSKKMADLQKEFINKMVANGSMTKAQGDEAIKRIDEMQKKQEEKGFIGGMGKGLWKSFGGRGGPGMNKIDTSKLTAQQKADLTALSKKMNSLQKEFIQNMVSNGLMTKEQGNNCIQNLDNIALKLQDNGMLFTKGFIGGFGFWGMKGIDTSKLTNQQKTDLLDYAQKMTAVQKESISKMMSYGLITKEDGNAMIQKMDDMLKNWKENGIPNGMGMMKGRHFGNFRKQGSPNVNKSAAPAA